MNNAQNAVTVLYTIHNHTHRDEVIDFVKVAVLSLHFSVNGIKMLGSAINFSFNPNFINLFL